MKTEDVLKDIESNTWWTEEFPGTLGLCMEFMDGFTGIRNHISPPLHSMSVLLLEKGSIREETKEDEKSQIFIHIIEEMKKDPDFVDTLIEKQKLVEDNLIKISEKVGKDLKSKSNEQLWSLFKEFYDNYIIFCEVAVIPEGGDPYAEHYLIPRLKDIEKIPVNEINDVMVTFSTPVMYSFMDNEHIEFLELCVAYLKKDDFERRLKEHSGKYHWLRNNYSQAYYLDEKYFLERVKEEVKGRKSEDIKKEIEDLKKEKEKLRKKKEEYQKKYRLSDETKLILTVYEKMGVWIDERKKRMVNSVHYHAKVLKEIAGRFSLEWNDINYYTIPEIKELLIQEKQIDRKELKSRFELSSYITTSDEKWLVTGEDARKIRDAFDAKISKEVIKGIVANKAEGKFTGEVCVMMDPHKEDLPQGKILVTSMTRPDFVHLIKKASAIVTDEGGITCHAAVVSREFGIPCIIGTKNATRMLKTGDWVEIDTEKGVVRRL
ncbi:MAG: hypothetical protein KKE20_06470 [Nanoarchaeota archaeon]|nr:hypothetical protein [Nanoarchaeota archaeon]